MQERRKFVRFRFPFCARYNVDASEPAVSAVTRDISYGGIRLIIDSLETLSENYPVYLEVVFPEETLKFCVKLVWKKKYNEEKQEAGFSFVKLPDSYKEIIYKYVFKYAPQQFNSPLTPKE
jgi:c-di-GMP-binding flagellar brake protein YcgR